MLVSPSKQRPRSAQSSWFKPFATKRQCWVLLLGGCLLLGLPSCQRDVCPSVGNSTMDDPTKAKKQRKPQSGLFGGKDGPRPR